MQVHILETISTATYCTTGTSFPPAAAGVCATKRTLSQTSSTVSLALACTRFTEPSDSRTRTVSCEPAHVSKGDNHMCTRRRGTHGVRSWCRCGQRSVNVAGLRAAIRDYKSRYAEDARRGTLAFAVTKEGGCGSDGRAVAQARKCGNISISQPPGSPQGQVQAERVLPPTRWRNGV